MQNSNVSWTDANVNSLYGCSACSPGCGGCYATRYLLRFAGHKRMNADGRFDGLVRVSDVTGRSVCSLTGRILFTPSRLYAALRDRTPKLAFVNEFSDLLHSALPLQVTMEHFRVFAHAPQHQFQILTKRSERLSEINTAVLAELGAWPVNVWMGVSVCAATDREFDRIRALGKTTAALRWISFEPWISDLDTPLRKARPRLRSLLRENKIAWVVVGGESGGREQTRIMTLDDARYLLEEGRAAGARVFFKQLGTALAIRLGVYSTFGKGEHRAHGGHPDQWPADLRIQEYPDVPVVSAPARAGFRPAFDAKTVMRFEGA